MDTTEKQIVTTIKGIEGEQPSGRKHKFDARQLIIDSEIMKPKWQE